MRARALTLVAVVLFAGCVGTVPDGLPSAGGSTVDTDNPWGERTLEVAVETPDNADREYGSLVGAALSYWEAHAEQYAGYPVVFDRVESADGADIVVSFVDEVTGCEDVREAAGCAPLVTENVRIDRPERMEVLAGLSDESTVMVLKHEFGHVLGLTHDDEPRDIMAAQADLEWRSRPNATERAFPWRDRAMSVYVDLTGVPSDDRDEVREQVRHAVAYYDAGAEGHVPANVTVTLTDDRDRADIVVSFPETAPCGSGDGSCGTRYGVDPDEDGAPEWYTGAEIAVAGIDVKAVGWHVGYWLGYAMGFDEPADWPAVLRNATAAQRRSDWWAHTVFRTRVAAPS